MADRVESMHVLPFARVIVCYIKISSTECNMKLVVVFLY